jgi:hypothetical protein
MALNKKQLINVSEQHKTWVEKVVRLSKENGQETNQTDIIRALLDQAMVQDPESFVTHLSKIRARARLDDIARRKQEIMDEEAQLLREVESDVKTAIR